MPRRLAAPVVLSLLLIPALVSVYVFDPHRGFSVHRSEGPQAAIDGRVFARNQANRGGGFYCVSNCRFEANRAVRPEGSSGSRSPSLDAC